MSKSFGKSRGQVAVLYTGIIAVLLGAVALGSDVAVMYVNWQQLQKAADAAVLVGGAGLPDNIPGATAAANAYLAVQTAARQLAAVDLIHLDYEGARTHLAGLTARHDEINKTADMPSRRAYRRARANIEGGGQSYGVDKSGSDA